jgi:hypothetical protein
MIVLSGVLTWEERVRERLELVDEATKRRPRAACANATVSLCLPLHLSRACLDKRSSFLNQKRLQKTALERTVAIDLHLARPESL